MKTCNKCNKCKSIKSVTDFYKYCHTRCKVCVREGSRKSKKRLTPALRKAEQLKHLYGLTLEEYSKMLEKQNNTCAICKIEQNAVDRKFDVDHCHKTGKVRGLLCISCNRGIGFLKDSPEIIQLALSYLTSYQEVK